MNHFQQIEVINERTGGVIVSWVEQKFCKVNKLIKLKSDNFKDVYKVVAVYGTVKSEDEVISDSQDYKRTRKASDI